MEQRWQTALQVFEKAIRLGADGGYAVTVEATRGEVKWQRTVYFISDRRAGSREYLQELYTRINRPRKNHPSFLKYKNPGRLYF